MRLDTTRAAPDVEMTLRYLVNQADHGFPALSTMHYAVVTESDGAHVVFEEGDLLGDTQTAEGVLDLVYPRVHQRAFELASLRGWVRVHAAAVDKRSVRTLMLAPSGGGKTTLSCQLLLAGMMIGGDESVLVRDGSAIPVARRMHLKAGLEDVVPGLRKFTVGLPSLADESVRAFDPAEAGFPWRITEALVTNVVLLERGEGPTDIAPLSAVDAMPGIVSEAFRHQEPVRLLVAQIASLLARARCWRLRMGSVSAAAELVSSLASPDN